MMKKLLLLIFILCCIPFAYARGELETANIKIHITGAVKDNRYFLCMPSIGCLSILAGAQGKVFPIIHSFKLEDLFVSNLNDFKVYPEGLPRSCQGTVEVNHTITIYGNLVKGANGIYLSGLHCTIN